MREVAGGSLSMLRERRKTMADGRKAPTSAEAGLFFVGLQRPGAAAGASAKA